MLQQRKQSARRRLNDYRELRSSGNATLTNLKMFSSCVEHEQEGGFVDKLTDHRRSLVVLEA